MERRRCKRFDQIAAQWDGEIASYEHKAVTKTDEQMQRRYSQAAETTKLNKARALNTHLTGCPLCR